MKKQISALSPLALQHRLKEIQGAFLCLNMYPDTLLWDIKFNQQPLMDYLLGNQLHFSKEQQALWNERLQKTAESIGNRPDFLEKALDFLDKGGWSTFKFFLAHLPTHWFEEDEVWVRVAKDSPSHLRSLEHFIQSQGLEVTPPFQKLFWACFEHGQAQAYWKWIGARSDFTSQEAVSLFLELGAHTKGKESVRQIQDLSKEWTQKGLSGQLPNGSWQPLQEAARLGLSVTWIQALTPQNVSVPQKVCETLVDWRLRHQDISVSFLHWLEQQHAFSWETYVQRQPAVIHALVEQSTKATLSRFLQVIPLEHWDYLFHGKTVLSKAVEESQLSVVSIMLDGGIPPTFTQGSLLEFSIQKMDIPMVSVLLQRKADFDKPDHEWQKIREKLEVLVRRRKQDTALQALVSHYCLERMVPEGQNLSTPKLIKRI